MRIGLSCGVLAACVALTACGGGGGGGGTPAASGPPAQLLITGGNAQAAGAHALDAVQDTSDAQGAANLVTGVQVAPGGTLAGIPLSRRLSDIALALAPSATQATLTVTGARLSQALPGRTTTCVDDTQVIAQNGSTFGSRLDGTVQTTSARLAPGGGSLLVATPTAVTWQAGGLPQAGIVTLTGANRSRATLTVAAGGAVTVAIDGNGDGDGTTDATQTTTVTALRALL